jgi:hypothetical protein
MGPEPPGTIVSIRPTRNRSVRAHQRPGAWPAQEGEREAQKDWRSYLKR